MNSHLAVGLLVALLLPSLALAEDAAFQWRDAAQMKIEGRGWPGEENPYARLPAKAKTLVRQPVWDLAQHTAGLSVRFVTDATTIAARWTPRSKRLEMPHMPATGVSGLDLYVRQNGRWHYLATGRPNAAVPCEAVLVRDLPPGEREFLLYLPLYNGLAQLEIGVPPSASFREANKPRETKPLVFYGTSITQGGCASRPGMAYPSIIGRALNVPVVNLGFSGNGKTEPEMARLLAELDPAAYILDSLANLETAQVQERLPPFIDILRQRHPGVPIVLLESIPYPDRGLLPKRGERYTGSNRVLRDLYTARIAQGDQRLYYVPSENLLGADGEATVDGVHPTDLGFERMAKELLPPLREILNVTKQ